MARKKVPLPDYLEELLALLEGQERPDRLSAIREVESRHDGLQIDVLAEMDEHPEFAMRYGKWLQRIRMGLEDAAVGRALAGKGSAASALKELRGLNGGKDSGAPAGRVKLEKHHEPRVEDFRRW